MSTLLYVSLLLALTSLSLSSFLSSKQSSSVGIFWGVVIAVNIVTTLLEILCLYLDSLSAAASISGLLGLDPWLMGYPLPFVDQFFDFVIAILLHSSFFFLAPFFIYT